MVALSKHRDERAYTTTMPTDLYAEVQRLAQVEGRSMNKQIVRALQEMLDNRRRSAPKAAAA